MKKGLGTLFVIIAGICWGLISIFVHGLNGAGMGSFDIMFVRTFIAIVLMFVVLLIFKRELLKISIKDIWMFIGTGIISLTFFTYCYFTTIVNVGAATAVVLLYTSPIFVMLLSALFFKERITIKKVAALVMTFAGCLLVAGIIGGGEKMTLASFFLGLCAGIGYALYSIFAGFAVKKYSSITITFYTFLFSGISLLALPMLLNPVEVVSRMVSPGLILYSVGIAVVCTVVPYITYTIGLSKMEKSRAAVLVTVEPLVGTLIGIFVWKESADPLKLLGIVLIFAAVTMLSAE